MYNDHTQIRGTDSHKLYVHGGVESITVTYTYDLDPYKINYGDPDSYTKWVQFNHTHKDHGKLSRFQRGLSESYWTLVQVLYPVPVGIYHDPESDHVWIGYDHRLTNTQLDQLIQQWCDQGRIPYTTG